ncbi:MAG: (Fe-S)-binding protein [Desulfovibrionaceae bacterium]|jgi:Fe-S oxidoreductase|nr:(Fe-S)-binding protein [Desulfovibrionaceae bacterium]
MYAPKDIVELLADNVRKTMSPFGVSKGRVNGWWKGQDLPRDGKALLFTGLMYQFVPYIEATTRQLERFEDTAWAGRLGWARLAPKFLAGLGLDLLASAESKRKAAEHLRDIVKVLRASGADFGYRPELDAYSGILLYDLGDQENFERHARIVAESLQQAGIERIITVDPHTTYALKVLYPKHLGISFAVRTYFEEASLTGDRGGETLVLHDPCFYGRYLELSDAPRRALAGLGYQCADLRESGAFTSCCGGPAESISPRLSAEIGARRVETLGGSGAQIVSMCPICLNNLEKSGANVVDLSSVLARGL